MFFIFGFGPRIKELGPGETRTCERCRNTTVWGRIAEWKQFTLFFVPIARWARREVEVCGVCGNAVPV